ncbi:MULTISPECIES: XrtA/PEP-CTERM system exopolysaccharide export protein [Rhodanobacter]|uniref:XrtA/PEP-CTERM system exopolysaccharide export protein n=1 Tax=Rhodanobacter TaxID=75309 RepID=UPI001E4BEFFB|nr:MULTISPECIES: XrtA/PEP-CTERM system exopolysaccharide export protein [Rhodanobacter]UJJ57554.1 polysaccharide export protein [Rhodanobacter denitrificans]UJM92970.1 polysaccharide export protein [Rhodanobacter denitrificans]UJN20670.1 polysaccharide export protein [Rhodanobacter denitrificans]
MHADIEGNRGEQAMRPLPGNCVFWLMMAAALLLGGCRSAPVIDGSAAAPPTTTEHYIIGPGDSLEIFVRDNPSLSTTVPVRPDGRISIPLVQSIVAAGETPEKLAGDLESALSRYVRSPLVTVIVKSFVGAYSQQVRVVGQAAMPKAVPYRSGMTLLDVMIEVGGLAKFAAGNDAKVARRLPDGSEQTIPVRLGDLMNGAIKYNMVMHPGDILIIPQSLL